jgi:peptidoglycan lytic transglycosylase B
MGTLNLKFLGLFFSLLIYVNISWGETAGPGKLLTVPEFVDRMVEVHHYDRRQLVWLFQHTEYLPAVIDRINKPFEEKPWDFYKNFFITPDRIADGVQYWREHTATLDAVSQQYGVPPAVIVAIIGIETKYGKEPFKYPALRTLATLAFQYPKRGVFFQNELENYLLLTREYHLPPSEIYSSYAGALGIPQFMPSNYRQYAISYTHQDSVNLLTNHDDAIASIAFYLQRSGWQTHQPVATPARISKPIPDRFISNDAKPAYHFKTLAKFGAKSSTPISPNRKSVLIVLHNTEDQEYWITFQNFYAIMAYNPRTTYAMAIYQLSEAIQKDYEQGITQKGAATSASR